MGITIRPDETPEGQENGLYDIYIRQQIWTVSEDELYDLYDAIGSFLDAISERRVLGE